MSGQTLPGGLPPRPTAQGPWETDDEFDERLSQWDRQFGHLMASSIGAQPPSSVSGSHFSFVSVGQASTSSIGHEQRPQDSRLGGQHSWTSTSAPTTPAAPNSSDNVILPQQQPSPQQHQAHWSAMSTSPPTSVLPEWAHQELDPRPVTASTLAHHNDAHRSLQATSSYINQR